jgi:hypothetical protein
MGFEEYWKNKCLGLSPSLEFAMKVIAKDAWRGGLLHAAEQDKKLADNAADNEWYESNIAFSGSAKAHEQAAHELK